MHCATEYVLCTPLPSKAPKECAITKRPKPSGSLASASLDEPYLSPDAGATQDFPKPDQVPLCLMTLTARDQTFARKFVVHRKTFIADVSF
jgi:hypothetical protein